MIEIDPK